MTERLAEWQLWLAAAQFIWGVALTVYVWRATRKKAREQMIQDIKASISERPTRGDLADAVQTIETRCQQRKITIGQLGDATRDLRNDIAHMPTHQDIKAISRDMNGLRSAISELNGRLSGINRAVDLINEFLINQGASRQ